MQQSKADMDEATRQHYEVQSKELRLKVKTWEAVFQKDHDGKKPGKDDIRRNPKIAATYKKYQEVRNILDGKLPPPRKDEDKDNGRKRKSPNPPSHTPSIKRFKQVETPSSRHHVNDLGHYTPSGDATSTMTPSLNRKLFSPVVPTSIGPTPQRDGRILGIFDHLPFKDAEIDSPCKPNASVRLSEVIEAGRETMVEETPRKSRTTDMDLASSIALGRTPSSRHKHRQQSPRRGILVTPLKPHDGNRVAKTPSNSSVSKLQFATPAFLRRIPMAKINESSEAISPEPIRLPRKPLLRGLSSVVADLRKMQEQLLDDDLDALREMENESNTKSGNSPTLFRQTKPAITKNKEEAAILAEDAQKQDLVLLGGFDDEAKYDSPDDDDYAGLDRDGKPLKVYKKKGQKRTTRKSNMKPVRAKRPNTIVSEKEVDGDEDDNITIEVQRDAVEEDNEDPALLSGSDFEVSEQYYDNDDDDEDELALDMSTRKPTRKSTTASNKKAAVTRKDTNTDGEKPEGTVKKVTRKVNELAHANFRRLKLRNNGAKGGPGYNSRFRRRR